MKGTVRKGEWKERVEKERRGENAIMGGNGRREAAPLGIYIYIYVNIFRRAQAGQ